MIVNLNNYRNWNRFVEHQAKDKYSELCGPLLSGLRFGAPISLRFTLWKASARTCDRANPLCIHEKYFCDALVNHGCIPDDSDEYIASTTYETGGIDRANPRVDIRITPARKNAE